MDALHGAHGAWFRQTNVVGIAAGRKIRRGERVGQALRVFVRRKLPMPQVPPDARIPIEVDGRALGIKGRLLVDVQAVGDPRPQSLVVVDRPLLPGYNVGDASGVSGTLGCIVKDRTTGDLLGLSCAHVLAPNGEGGNTAIYAPSYQEAVQSQVLGEAQIGTLGRIAKIGFSPADSHSNVDAATFRPTDVQKLSSVVAIVGQKPRGVRPTIPTGLAVRKVGSISGETHGVVQTTTACVKLTVAGPGGTSNEALFIDQIGVTSFTDDGDSGALVMDDSYFAVGLHFWAADGLSVCQPIQRVLDSLDCDLA